MKVCQKADFICFHSQERSADGGIHAAKDLISVRSVLQNTKKKIMAVQKKRHGMLTYSVVVLHGNVCLLSATHTGALPEHFNWEFV
jgi:hypothetical protein